MQLHRVSRWNVYILQKNDTRTFQCQYSTLYLNFSGWNYCNSREESMKLFFFKHEIAYVFTCCIFLKGMSRLFYSLIVHLQVQMVPVWLNIRLIFLSLYGITFCYCDEPAQMYWKHWFIVMCSHEIAAFIFVLPSDIHPLGHPKWLCILNLL